jgi:hypothetical protein
MIARACLVLGFVLAPVAVDAAGPAREAVTAEAETRVTLAEGIVLGLSVSGVASPSTAAFEPRVSVRDGEVYRLIVDRAGRARFSYAIRVDPVAGSVELAFRPVRLHEALRAFAPSQRFYDLPFRLESGLVTLPDIQTSGAVSAGDTITLDLFDNRDTGQRIADQVRVIAISAKAVEQLAASRKARLESPAVLTIAGKTIRRGGQVINSDKPGTLATGQVVGLGLGADVGTVIFSAEPSQTQAPYGVATVDGHTLRFTLDDQEYECSGTEPIGPPGLTSVWMYVRREPLPFGNGKGFVLLASDSGVDGMMNLWHARPR